MTASCICFAIAAVAGVIAIFKTLKHMDNNER
jgi:hypothetical protein